MDDMVDLAYSATDNNRAERWRSNLLHIFNTSDGSEWNNNNHNNE